MGGKVLDGGEVPNQVSGCEVNTVGQQEQIHEEGGLVEPVRVEVTGPEGHGPLHKVQLVAEIGEGKIVKETTQPERGGNQENDPETNSRRRHLLIQASPEPCQAPRRGFIPLVYHSKLSRAHTSPVLPRNTW
jgi:hypothetical protein